MVKTEWLYVYQNYYKNFFTFFYIVYKMSGKNINFDDKKIKSLQSISSQCLTSISTENREPEVLLCFKGCEMDH